MATPMPKVREIPIADIDVDEQKIREIVDDDSIGELAESITRHGLLQPIGVTAKPDGRYQLRWGLRRLTAHRRAAMAKIKAIEYDGDEKSVKALAYVENLHRQEMTMADEVNTVIYLLEEEEKSVEQICSTLSKSRTWVLNRLMVPGLPDYLREPLIAGDLAISHVEIIAKVPDPGAQSYLASMALAHRWNRSQLKTMAEAYMTPVPQPEPTPGGTPGVNPNPPMNPFLYVCQVCNEKGTLDQFDLVRVHKDGQGCRTISDRPNHESDSINGLERGSD